ncbi:MAG TPA: LLM class flavin-dependent oxidoreductase [Stellaceae bacterium]|nr:LLM class flavin-dependent oxidoreductase [Stellaceae bacterium]
MAHFQPRFLDIEDELAPRAKSRAESRLVRQDARDLMRTPRTNHKDSPWNLACSTNFRPCRGAARRTYEGRYYSFDNVTLVPKPYQKPHPPFRIAAASADTFPAIGELGCPIFVAVRHGTFSELVPSIRAYREAYRAAGHPGEGEVYLRVPAYLAETEERARSELRAVLMHLYQRQAGLAIDSARRSGGLAAEQRVRRAERLRSLTYEDALRTQVICSSPEGFAERLRGVQQELGLDGILAELNCGGRIRHERVVNAIRLLCEEVMPEFAE